MLTLVCLAGFACLSSAEMQAEGSPMLQPQKPTKGTLPLPPVGAALGSFGAWEKSGLMPGKEPVLSAKPGDSQVTAFSLSHLSDPYGGNGYIKVSASVSKGAPDHYLDIYVSGYYVGVNGEFEGLKGVGKRPAYEYYRSDMAGLVQRPGSPPNSRLNFRIPDVLPAKVRIELYHIPLGKPARLLAKKEATFDTDWKDYGVVEGHLFGDIKKMITKASFLVEPGTESVNVRVPALRRVKPDDTSNDLNISLSLKGQTQAHELINKNIEGREFNWKAAFISATPWQKDRDIRNSQYWPYLTGGGYLDIPPIKAGDASVIRFP